MNRELLNRLLSRFPSKTVVVVGDFFLDKYLIVDPKLEETSIETGLAAHQVVGKRLSPGAAGTVASNLSALGIGKIHAVGFIGADGEGFDLRQGLESRRITTEYHVETPKRATPTYTKPLAIQPDGSEVEMNRQDIKNRTPTPAEIEGELIERLRGAVAFADAVIVMDQVQERNCGVVTDKVRAEIAALARSYSDTVFFGDSRVRIGDFRDIYIKPNDYEAVRAIDPDFKGEPSDTLVRECAAALAARTGKPLYVTRGARGMLVYDGTRFRRAPTVEASGPIDIVGAGDSATAGIVSALCSGALLTEAATLGNIVASITIQQLGTTGTASPEQVRERFEAFVQAGIADG